MENSSKRVTIRERLDEHPWKLSEDLFGNVGAEIYDFLMENYVYFLDHAGSLADLKRGLWELRPLFDDALDVAEQMNDRDFKKFKLALCYERELAKGIEGRSKMPARYLVLLFPRRLVKAFPLAEQALVPLGVALIRVAEFEEENAKQ